MCVRIIVDSSTDVSEKYREKIQFVPLTVRFGDKEYLDGVELSKHQFYEMLVESDVLPTTSQATPAAFAEYLESVASAGDSAVVITLSSKLSGTYQSAVLAAEDYPNIYVVDSQSVAIGTGVLAQYAVELAQQGMGAEEIAQVLTQQRENVCVVALLDTLEYLKKGGRISKTVAFVGGALAIKPVVAIVDGKVILLGKARGSKNGENFLMREAEKAGLDFSRPICLGYTGFSDAMLQKYMEDSRHLWEGHEDSLPICTIGATIGTHIGPNAIALSFFVKK